MRAPLVVAAVVLFAFAACNDSASPDTSSGGARGTSGGIDDGAAPPADAGRGSGADGSSGGGDAGSDGGDGGTGRDLSANKAAFFGASRCAKAGVKLCEDFESGTLDGATWKVTGAAPVVDGVQHARGAKALHITVSGNGPSYIRETKTFPAANNTYWGRIFVWFESLPAPPMTYAHWTFGAATGSVDKSEIRLSGQLQNGANHFGVGTDNQTATGTGDWTNSDKDPGNSPLAVPTKQWLCIEWLHKGDTNDTRFFWDAIEHPSLATTMAKHGGNTNAFVLPQFTSLWLGWDEYQPSTEKFEMWLDEIAVDTQRIGCVL